MYITDFVCTYKKFENEKDSDDIYRSQFLQAFGLDNWNYKKIEEIQDDLFFYVKNDSNGMKILETLYENKQKFPMLGFILTQTKDLENIKEIFFILFSYEYFYLFHNCLIDLFNKHKISDENTNNLINNILNTK